MSPFQCFSQKNAKHVVQGCSNFQKSDFYSTIFCVPCPRYFHYPGIFTKQVALEKTQQRWSQRWCVDEETPMPTCRHSCDLAASQPVHRAPRQACCWHREHSGPSSDLASVPSRAGLTWGTHSYSSPLFSLLGAGRGSSCLAFHQ